MKKLKELMNLKGRVALITGGAGHIGFAMAEALAELGANIVILDIKESESGKKAKVIEKRYRVKTLPLVVDLAQEDQVRSVAGMVLKRFKRLDILVHCAALVGTAKLEGFTTPFLAQSTKTWRMALEVNLTSAFTLVQASMPALSKSGHGSVVLVSSIYGLVGPDMGLYQGTKMGNSAAYSASKGGLLQLTRWFATALAPKVRFNAITPGGVYRQHKNPFISRYVARTPMKRMASEEDLKGAVAYLASDLSDYVTGQNIVVDGGWTAW